MNVEVKKQTVYDRHPELKLTPEERQKRNDALRALLQSWVDEGDADEQRETLDALMEGLRDPRESNREPEKV